MMKKLEKLFTNEKVVFIRVPCKFCYNMRKFNAGTHALKHMKVEEEEELSEPETESDDEMPELDDRTPTPPYDIDDNEQFPALKRSLMF